jgi:hypothetical protein
MPNEIPLPEKPVAMFTIYPRHGYMSRKGGTSKEKITPLHNRDIVENYRDK